MSDQVGFKGVDCKICGSNSLQIQYKGPIRLGKIDDISGQPFRVFKCSDCQVSHLPDQVENVKEFYTSGKYREQVGENTVLSDYYKLHDKHIDLHFQVYPLHKFRNKVVADIGCGGGVFLDAVSGFAADVIGVEKNEDLLTQLSETGTRVYSDASELEPNSIDIASSFSVIEHLEDPLGFLQNIKRALKTGGLAIISTPNENSFLMNHGPQEFKSFFYRKVHTYYFGPEALNNIVEKSGFVVAGIRTVQEYGLSNMLCWLRDKKGKGDTDFVNNKSLEVAWKNYLDSTLMGDRLYIICSKE